MPRVRLPAHRIASGCQPRSHRVQRPARPRWRPPPCGARQCDAWMPARCARRCGPPTRPAPVHGVALRCAANKSRAPIRFGPGSPHRCKAVWSVPDRSDLPRHPGRSRIRTCHCGCSWRPGPAVDTDPPRWFSCPAAPARQPAAPRPRWCCAPETRPTSPQAGRKQSVPAPRRS